MIRRTIVALAGVLVAASAFSVLSAQGSPDLVLSNGKIITVDERFTIAQAVAIRGDQIVAVGTNQEIDRLAGAGARRIDLRGRAVIPGLIDNHMHLLRYGTTWRYEVRWDGIASRKQALGMLRARTQTVKPGEWIYTLGGWALEQFADNPKPFTREELDRIAPDHPVFLQASYFEAFLNSKALEVLGIEATAVGRVPRSGPATSEGSGPAGPGPATPDAAGVDRDAAGRAT